MESKDSPPGEVDLALSVLTVEFQPRDRDRDRGQFSFPVAVLSGEHEIVLTFQDAGEDTVGGQRARRKVDAISPGISRSLAPRETALDRVAHELRHELRFVIRNAVRAGEKIPCTRWTRVQKPLHRGVFEHGVRESIGRVEGVHHSGGFLRSLNDTELSTTESLHGEGRHRISRQESVRPGETDQAQKRHNQRGPRHRPHRTHRPHWSPTPFTPLIACEREVPPACPDPERSCRAPRETRKTEQSCTAGEKPRV